MTILDYKSDEAVGSVYSVDTGTVVIKVIDLDRLRSMQVNQLVAIRSSKSGQHLIGMIAKITRRTISEQLDVNSESDDLASTNVENVMKVSLIGTLIDLRGSDENVFKRTLETVPEIDAFCFVLDGDRLTLFMRSISKSSSEGKQPLSLGTYSIDEDAKAWIDGNKFFQRHAVIVGSTGSGKSWTVAHIVEQVADLPNANAILFDIHGEYTTLCGQGIQHLRIAGPADIDDAHSLDNGIIFLPYWLLTYEEMLALMLDRSDANAPNQAMVFSRSVTDAKRSRLDTENKLSTSANFTIDSPIPYSLNLVYDELSELDIQMVPGARTDKQGPFHGKLTRFLQRLDAKRNDRRLKFLFTDGFSLVEYNWMQFLCNKLMLSTEQQNGGGVKVIDFSEVPSDILPLMIGLVSRIIFSVQQWINKDNQHPIALICDEAHLYVPARTEDSRVSEAALDSFERIAKEGRKYGLGLVVISQRPAEVNRTVLSQCNNYVAMRLTNADDQSVVRRLLPDNLGGFTELLPILDVGEALVVGDCSMLPSRVKVDLPDHKPKSSTVDFWDEWCKAKVEEGISQAVEFLRKQSKSTS